MMKAVRLLPLARCVLIGRPNMISATPTLTQCGILQQTDGPRNHSRYGTRMACGNRSPHVRRGTAESEGMRCLELVPQGSHREQTTSGKISARWASGDQSRPMKNAALETGESRDRTPLPMADRTR